MQLLVLLETLLRHEAVHALVTFVRRPAGHPVVLESLTANEDHRADLTLVEGPFLVDRRMILELPFGQEFLLALLALVLGYGFVVQGTVLHKHVVGVENGTALRTGKRPRASVSVPDVVQQVRLGQEELLTLVTVESSP